MGGNSCQFTVLAVVGDSLGVCGRFVISARGDHAACPRRWPHRRAVVMLRACAGGPIDARWPRGMPVRAAGRVRCAAPSFLLDGADLPHACA